MSKYISACDNEGGTADTWWMEDRNVVKYTGGHRATLITETNHRNLGLKILKIEAKKMMNKSSRLSIKACNPDGRGITDDRCVYLGRH